MGCTSTSDRLDGRFAVTAALLVAVAGCGDLEPIGCPGEGGLEPWCAAALPWGDYAASLDVPPCPAGEDLIVNTATDELDGGTGIMDRSEAGEVLSLVEALWIAANRPGQDNVYFDPDVFPAASPATIQLSSTTLLPGSLTPACIDGRGRGVVIGGSSSFFPIWTLGDGDLQVGLVLRRHYVQSVEAGGQVAGCRYTSGFELPLFVAGGLAGPGNAFEGDRSLLARAGIVTESFFGLDPAAQRLVSLEEGVHCMDGAVIERNVFLSRLAVASFGACTLRDNLVGMDPSGVVHPVVESAVGVADGSTGVVVGPGNVIRGTTSWAIAIQDNSTRVRITQNSISANERGIVYYDHDWMPPDTQEVLTPTVGPVAPPTIASATASRVEGLCAVAGTVELFSDPGDQGEWYLGSTACDGVSPWSLDASVPRGRNVTATLTDEQGRTSSFSTPYAVP